MTRVSTTTTDAYVDPDTGELITPEDFIARAEWTFAKSMPHLPHEYTVKGKTAPGGRVFEWFVALVRAKGERRTFGRRVFPYLPVGEFEYWAMSPPGIATVINRQRIETKRLLAWVPAPLRRRPTLCDISQMPLAQTVAA